MRIGALRLVVVDYRTELLVVARSAYRRNDWGTSYESFRQVDGLQQLDTEDLAAFGSVAWRQGHGREAVRINERVHTRLLRTDPVSAAMKAAELGLAWLTRGHVDLARGWAQRGTALLRGVPEAAAHGYLTYLVAVIEAESGSTIGLSGAARELSGIAVRLDDGALGTLAQVLAGLATADDSALDDVLLPILEERVPVEWAGDVYRRLLTRAARSGDDQRLRSWTRSMRRWCEAAQPENTHWAYGAICEVHQLSVEPVADPKELIRRGIDLRRLVGEVDAVAASLADALLARGMRG